MDKFAKMALEEYNSGERTTRRAGTYGRPFWNVNSSQFMFVPQLYFPTIPGTEKYIYTATDSTGASYSFEANIPTADLSPIWADIAVGFVTLKVEAVHRHLGRTFIAGCRTFYKSAPFPGREAYGPAARSYKECAIMAFKYVISCPSNRYWLEHGLPDPEYYHNVYPSKTTSSLINAMVAYATIDPENSEEAIRLACAAADYLISITYGEDSVFCGLPPTYSFLGLNKENIDYQAPAAYGRRNTLMMLYPAFVGSAYLRLEAATGNKKYFEYAKKIADYYKEHVLPNGSWYLLIDGTTGLPESGNCCAHFGIIGFFKAYRARTGEDCWLELERNYYKYIEGLSLENYNWEGQFEDVSLTANYQNLTHLQVDAMIEYITTSLRDDEKMMGEAVELMRFVEDQFVVWGEHAPWNDHKDNGAYWYSPAGLEQYGWYVPIDGSTAQIMDAFLNMYLATKEELYLEKARALADAITRMQNPENGVIPTHWMKRDCAENLHNFWLNCHIGTAFKMMRMAKILEEN